jgi:hypothetical protein
LRKDKTRKEEGVYFQMTKSFPIDMKLRECICKKCGKKFMHRALDSSVTSYLCPFHVRKWYKYYDEHKYEEEAWDRFLKDKTIKSEPFMFR